MNVVRPQGFMKCLVNSYFRVIPSGFNFKVYLVRPLSRTFFCLLSSLFMFLPFIKMQ